MNARKVILDCDPGIDDALALMLALSLPGLDVIGITVVCGNVPVEKGVKNALKILELMNRTEIPVYAGEAKPLVRPYVDAMDTHGGDGLGESAFPDPAGSPAEADAVSYLSDVLLSEEQVSVIALGPLTNLTRLLERSPEAFARIQELVSMGGTYKSHGNCSPVAEYNYWCDPDAAAKVFEAYASLPELSGKNIHMIGLDVTRKIVLTPNLIEYMKRLHPFLGGKIEAITRFYLDFHWEQEGIIGCVINDPLAVAYFADHSICSGFDAYTSVETGGISYGQTLVDACEFWKKPHNSHILTETDPYRFWLLFCCRVLGADETAVRHMLSQILTEEVTA